MTDFFTTIKQYTNDLVIHAGITTGIIGKPTVILGFSGGPDSMFLFHVLRELHNTGSLTVVAAHLDHGWRTTSDIDAQFCTDICTRAGITCVIGHAADYQANVTPNGSQEEVGRHLRRLFFADVKEKYKAHFVVLAHHRQDQEETFFIRLIRGTSITGLTCMKEVDGWYLRPLLSVDKQTMIDYLITTGIAYLVDPTNEADTYLRNRIRKSVIPALTGCDARFSQKLENTIKNLQEEELFLQELTLETYKKIMFASPTVGDLPAFKSLSPVLQRRVILHLLITNRIPFSPSTTFLEEVRRFLVNPRGGSHTLGTWKVCKKGSSFWLER